MSTPGTEHPRTGPGLDILALVCLVLIASSRALPRPHSAPSSPRCRPPTASPNGRPACSPPCPASSSPCAGSSPCRLAAPRRPLRLARGLVCAHRRRDRCPRPRRLIPALRSPHRHRTGRDVVRKRHPPRLRQDPLPAPRPPRGDDLHRLPRPGRDGPRLPHRAARRALRRLADRTRRMDARPARRPGDVGGPARDGLGARPPSSAA